MSSTGSATPEGCETKTWTPTRRSAVCWPLHCLLSSGDPLSITSTAPDTTETSWRFLSSNSMDMLAMTRMEVMMRPTSLGPIRQSSPQAGIHRPLSLVKDSVIPPNCLWIKTMVQKRCRRQPRSCAKVEYQFVTEPCDLHFYLGILTFPPPHFADTGMCKYHQCSFSSRRPRLGLRLLLMLWGCFSFALMSE